MTRYGSLQKLGLGLGLVGALLATSAVAARTLSAAELKALISDKTVLVTRLKDGAQWRVYFGPDGKQITKGDRNSEGDWWIAEDGKHCNAEGMLKCASIVDNGDGTYSRMKEDGQPLVSWSEFSSGNKL